MKTSTGGCGCGPTSSGCGSSCCEGNDPRVPEAIDNAPGQAALRYRVGTYASFFESMLAWLVGPPESPARCAELEGEPEPDPIGGAWPLRELTTRECDDPTIALIDAWAIVGDVLTFYQERIVNEGFLRTATEQRSVEAIARLVGHRPRPGVAASLDLAFTLDRDVVTTIPAGTRAQSLPSPGKLPQSFETSAALVANARWNALRPLQSRFMWPQVIDDRLVVHLAGTATNLRTNDVVYRLPATSEGKTPAELADAGLFRVDRIEILADIATTRVHLRRYTNDEILDDLEDAPEYVDDSDEEVGKIVASFSQASNEAESNDARYWSERALLELVQSDRVLRDSFRRAIEEVGAARESKTRLFVFRASSPLFGHNAAAGRYVGTDTPRDWPLPGDEGNYVVFLDTVNERVQPNGYLVIDQATAIEAPPSEDDEPYPVERILELLAAAGDEDEGEDEGEGEGEGEDGGGGGSQPHNEFALAAPTESYLATLAESPNRIERFWFETLDAATQHLPGFEDIDEAKIKHALAKLLARATNKEAKRQRNEFILDVQTLAAGDEAIAQAITAANTAADKVAADGKINKPLALHEIDKVRTYSRDAYGITKQTLELTVKGEHAWFQWPATTSAYLAPLRSVVTYHESEPLRIARTPLERLDGKVFEAGKLVEDKLIELDGLIFDLQPGRALILEGEDADAPGSLRTERVTIATIEHDLVEVSTRITLTTELEHAYRRDRTILYGNVASATQGETRTEVLGSGDASKPSQRFTLRHQPLTHVPADTPEGAASTLVVRVQGFAWPQVEHRSLLGPRERGIVTQTDEQGRTIVIGGDGRQGARFPTGVENITAQYRSGQGSDGNVDPHKATNLATRPFGVQKVTNPMPASGGSDPDDIEATRTRAPLAVEALDRLLSVEDHRSFALRFAGIAKATATRVGSRDVYARWRVRTVVAGVDARPLEPDSALVEGLRASMHRYGDPSLALDVVPATLARLTVKARVAIAAGYTFVEVEPRLRAALLDALSYARQAIGQAIWPSRVVALAQAVAGVAFVDLDALAIAGGEVDEDPLIFDPKQNAAVLPDPDAVLYLDPDQPETLVLEELTR